MDGILRIKRGSALPVEVKSNISDVLLIRAAVNKHSAFHKHLVDGSTLSDTLATVPDQITLL